MKKENGIVRRILSFLIENSSGFDIIKEEIFEGFYKFGNSEGESIMKQDMIVVLDLSGTENTVVARQISGFGRVQ